jgi:hypothetical protein
VSAYDTAAEWEATLERFYRATRRNPIALDLTASCPHCIHLAHAEPCSGYREPYCSHDTDVCGCQYVTLPETGP